MTLSEFFLIAPFSWVGIATALSCGTLIGLERQLRGKPVGIRTSSLIVLGTYIFVTSGMVVSGDSSDPTRIIGQVVVGVGFLGAGVMMTREGVILGVTSAATIWTLAALGVVIAIHGEAVAIKLALVVLAILAGVDILESYSTRLTRGVHSIISDLADWDKKEDRDPGSEK